MDAFALENALDPRHLRQRHPCRRHLRQRHPCRRHLRRRHPCRRHPCRPSARVASAALLAVALFLGWRSASASTHPPDLRADGDCEAWVGTLNGNDTDVRVSARLCPAGGDAVKGQFQTSSLKSGYSVRDLEGRWLDGGAKFEGHDTRMVESHPNPGWMFCTVDSYDLARTAPDELVGTLLSRACHDNARVVLKRVPKDAAPPPASATGDAPPPPASATGDAPPPPASATGDAPPPPGSGTPSGSSPSPAPPPPTATATAAVTPAPSASTPAPPPQGLGSATRELPVAPAPAPSGGCGCTLGPAPPGAFGALGLAALAGLVAWRRRRLPGRGRARRSPASLTVPCRRPGRR